MAENKTKNNLAINEKLDRMAEFGMRKTESFTDMWTEGLKYFYGEQLADKEVHKNFDWVIVNYILPSSLQEIAKLSKNNPKIFCHPWSEDDTEAAETWQSKLNWDWQKGLNKHGMRLEQIAAILDGKLFGYRVSKIFWEDKDTWDEKTQQWVGNAKYRLWHPRNFWATGTEKIDDGDCGTQRYVTLEWAKIKWPEFAKELEKEADAFGESGMGKSPAPWGSKSTGSAAAVAAGLSPGIAEQKQSAGLTNHIVDFVLSHIGESQPFNSDNEQAKIVKIEEFYFRDYEEEDVKIEQDIPQQELLQTGQIIDNGGIFIDAQTGLPLTAANWPKNIIQYKRPKYPNGRFIIRCGKTILNPKEEDQIYPYSRWPFVVLPHYLLPHLWQGFNAVELYRSMQDMINVSISFLFNYVKLFGAPKIGVEADSLAINPQTKKHYKLGLGAGAIIKFVRGGLERFKIFPPAPMSPGVITLFQLFSQEFKNLTGLQSIARGERQPGGMTATEARELTISSNDRIALQSIYEDAWVKEVMTIVAEICQKKYEIDRWIRIVGEDNTIGAQQITQQMKDVKFDVDIEAGSQMPFDEEKKVMKYLQAYNILSNPNPNPLLPDLLRVLEIGNWKKILDQMESWQQFQQFKSLYDGVTSGQVAPEQAVQILTQKAIENYRKSNPAGAIPAGGGGQPNAGGV